MILFNSFTSPSNQDASLDYSSPYLELTDTFAHHYNRHILKYGASFRRTQQKSTDYAGAYPDITLGTTMGNAPEVGPEGNDVISDADRQAFEGLYNDILGRIESISQIYQYDTSDYLPGGSGRRRDFTSYEFAGFFQDDWRIRPDLTLNLGVRYDLFSVPHEKNGLQLVLDPRSNIGPAENYSDFTLVPGNKWRDQAVSNFAPRAGFAWDISGYGTFVLRGSFGMFYSRFPGSITSFIDQNTYGLSQAVTTNPNIGGGDFRLGDESVPYPTIPSEGPDPTPPSTRSASIAVFAPNLKTPRMDRFNLTLERRLTDHLVVDVSFVSARGRNLYQNLNYNQVKTQSGFLQDFLELKAFRDEGTPLPETNSLLQMFGSAMAAWEAIGADSSGISYVDSGQAGIAADVIDRNYFGNYPSAGLSNYYLRNYPQFDRFIVGTDTGRSWYDALQFGFRANSGSLRVRGYYTWSKSLDTLSVDGDSFVSPRDSMNPMANKAPSEFDRKHTINFSGSLNVPFGRNRRWGSESSGVLSHILGNWEVGFISLWQTGARFSVYSSLETLYSGVDSLADYNSSRVPGSLNYTPVGVYWFNFEELSLFGAPEAGEAGSSSRHFFRGPQYFDIDLTLFKSFSLSDSHQIQVRGEFYNLFNRTHFGTPVNNLSESSFGLFTSTIGTPRRIQFAVRYSF